MQVPITYNRLINVATHVLVWAVFGLAIYYYQPIISDVEIPVQFWLKQTMELGLLVFLFYMNSELLVPYLLLKNQRFTYFLIVGFMVLGVVLTHRSLDRAYGDFQMRRIWSPSGTIRPQTPPTIIPFRRGVSGSMLTLTMTLMVVGISTAITASNRSLQDRRERETLEKDKVTTELSFLKHQINPHFYFNTLNNIYALTEVDPKLAGEAILQLSRMMRYLIYDTQQGTNMLSQEIAFLKNYIHLMKLRMTDMVKLVVDMPDQLDDMPLAPLILLPFVENAFKHGVSTTRKSHIDIRVTQKGRILDLVVSNAITHDGASSLELPGGIGLSNTRRRLALLYPGKHTLDVAEHNDRTEYSIHLVLDLS
jgi:two-component system, LytTR family, sensor kinase